MRRVPSISAGWRRAGRDGQRGVAIFLVLWFLAPLALLGAHLTSMARSEARTAHNLLSAAQLQALADAGVALAIENLYESSGGKQFSATGQTRRVTISNAEVTVRLVEESARINPNLARPQLLSCLFAAVGLDTARSDALAQAIGAAIHPPGSRDAPPADNPAALPSIDDLLTIDGMTAGILTKIRPFITVYSFGAEPSLLQASPIVAQIAASCGKTQTSPTIAASGEKVETGGSLEPIRIVSEARRDGKRFVRVAVVQPYRNPGVPVKTLLWSADPSEGMP
jgi:general secretion pathway protein K